jgi:hypothetical protein
VIDLARKAHGGPDHLGGWIHLNLGRRRAGGAHPRACSVCGWIAERECDWKVAAERTCDRALCSYCTFEPSPEKDLCPEHVGAFKAWCAARTNSTDGPGP